MPYTNTQRANALRLPSTSPIQPKRNPPTSDASPCAVIAPTTACVETPKVPEM